MKNLTLSQIVGLQEAKEVLMDDLNLRAIGNRPQKMILLEGASGGGKTTLVKAIADHYIMKYPDRFQYIEIGINETTEHVTSTSKKITHLYSRIREANKPTILFLDEADTVFASRLNAGHIREERTSSLMRELNDPIPNLYIICCTNRPKRIDRAVLERFAERVNCPMPNSEEIRQMVDLHLQILDERLRKILYDYIITSDYYWSGRDFEHFEDKLTTKRDVFRIDNPSYEIDASLVSRVFDSVVNSKKHLKDDYLEE